ncbi:AlpA family phage regulatory protein [Variovorax sp. CCNWLW186]|uniref:helix-turn-helix transcriptional regulator n=1 Tax=Variovorax sp. CCNWLW186 TaxID=3127473 RepID=UPI0030780D49
MNSEKRAAQMAQAQPKGYMRQYELLMILPFSAATLWRKVRAGTFVQPVKFSERVTAWNRAKVQEWLDAQEAA